MPNKILLVPNKATNGFNYDLYLSALNEELKLSGISSDKESYRWQGTEGNIILSVDDQFVSYSDSKFIVKNITFDSEDIILRQKQPN